MNIWKEMEKQEFKKLDETDMVRAREIFQMMDRFLSDLFFQYKVTSQEAIDVVKPLADLIERDNDF